MSARGGCREPQGSMTTWPKVPLPHGTFCDILSFRLLPDSIFLHISLLKSRATEGELGMAFRCPSHSPCLGTDSGSQLESRGKFQEVGDHRVGDSGRRWMICSVFWGRQSIRP